MERLVSNLMRALALGLSVLIVSASVAHGETPAMERKAGEASSAMLFEVEERIMRNEGWVLTPEGDYDKVLGVHFVFELSQVKRLDLISDAAAMERILVEASAAGGLTTMKSNSVQFEGKGAGSTAFVVLSESHISVHTWPEHAYVAADIFTCGEESGAKAALAYLAEALGGEVYISGRVARGIPGKQPLVERFYAPEAALHDLESRRSEDGDHQTLAEAWSHSLSMKDMELLFGNTQQDWETIYQKPSQWQNIEFIREPEGGDVCLVLDNTVQICDSHNSGYSEVYVHLPIAFLPSVEKALIIGGGDGLALRELLKYKSIERVVQLELDREVVETCEKYLGVNGHLPGGKDTDPRVDWRFGDAAKTIEDLLADGEHFDVVLLDISETDPSGSVSTEDFFRSVARTLKPHGIFIKNGNYQAATSNLFEEFLEVIYPVPVIASQTFVLGSNGTSLLFPSFELFEKENITTSYLVDGPQDQYKQLRSMIRRYSKRGLDYEYQAAKRFTEVTQRNPYAMAAESERTTSEEPECADPYLRPCFEEYENHPLVVPLSDWAKKDCKVMPKHGALKIIITNVSPDPISVLWVNLEGQYEEEVIIFKKLVPGASKTLNTYLGHRFKIVDHEAVLTTIKDFDVTTQLLSHPYVDMNGLHKPLIAKRFSHLSSVHRFRNSPAPSDHDKSVEQF